MPIDNSAAPIPIAAPNAYTAARWHGYTDPEIVDYHLQQGDPQFKAAQDAGYSPTEIMDHLAQQPPQPSPSATHVFTIQTPTGQKLDIEAADEATALRGAQWWHKQNAPSTGVAAGLQQGLSDLVRGDSQSSQQVLGTDGSMQKTADAIAPKNYQSPPILSPDSHWYDPTSYNWKNVPQKLAEAAPGVVQDLAVGRTAGAVGGPGVGLAAGLGSMAWRMFGPEAKAAAYARTGDATAEPNDADKQHALVKVAAQTAIQGVGFRRLLPIGQPLNKGIASTVGNMATTAGTEAAAGATANAAGQLIDTGTVDPQQVAEQGITQGLGAGVLAAPHAAGGAIDAVKYHAFTGALENASTNFANRVTDAAGGRSLGDTSVGYDAVDKASSAVKSELGDAVKSITTPLPTDAQNIIDSVQKGKLPTVKDYSTLLSALQGDPAGPAVMNLVSEAHVSQLVKASGNYSDGKFTGGITPAALKLTGLSGHNTARSVLAALAVEHLGAHLIAASPATIGVALAGAAAAKGIDSITGAHAPAQRFVNRFGNDGGVVRTPISGPVQAQPQPNVPMPTSPTGPKIAVSPAAIAAQMGNGPWTQTPTPQPSSQALKQMATQAMPMLRKLAATSGPNAPLTLPSDFAGMLSNPGNSVLQSPLAKPVVPTVDPLVAQGINGAAALNKVTPQPSNEQVPPSTPMGSVKNGVAAAQVMRKLSGAKAGADSTVDEVPVPSTLLHTKVGPADYAIAHQATEQFKRAINAPDVVAGRYYDSTAQRQALIRDRLMQLSGDPRFASDNVELGAALDKVRQVRSREALAAHINDVTSTLPPAVANTIRAYLGPTWAKSVWNPSRITK